MKYLFLYVSIILSTVAYSQVKIDKVKEQHVGKQFAEFAAVDLHGNEITAKQLIGKITFVNFWFIGCPPCVAEFKTLNELYVKYKNNPNFQFISFTKDSRELAEESVEKHQLLYAVCPIANDCYRLNFNSGFPTNIIVDKTGKVVFHKSGGPIQKEYVAKEFEEIEELITNLLK